MPIEGPLRELALSDVLQLLDLSRKTGVLTVYGESRARPAVLRFDRGRIVAAEVPDAGARLGQLLLRAGKITTRDLERARAIHQREPHRPLGVVLRDLGLVPEAELRKHLRFQIEETIYEIVRWRDGYFRFEETPPPDPSTVLVRVPTESVLMEAARQIDEWAVLEEKIPHMDVVPAITAGDGDGSMLDLQPAEWEVLAEIDGQRTLRQIARDLGRGEFEVAKIAYGLLSGGLIEIVDERPAPPPVAAADDVLRDAREALRQGKAAHAYRLVEDLLSRFSERADVHEIAGQALLKLARWREAAEAFQRATERDPLAAEAYYGLGLASLRSGELARAAEAWRTYLRLPEALPDRAVRVRAILPHLESLHRWLEEAA